jgi:starch synthase
MASAGARGGRTAGNEAGANATAPGGNRDRLKIVMVATEAVPFAKEGGVADVMGSLPKELAALGHEVCLVLPRYGSVDPERWGLQRTGLVRSIPFGPHEYLVRVLRGTLPDSTVTVYFLDNPELFGRYQKLYLGQEQREEQRRFILFCRSLVEMLPALDIRPDILHLNDWQTAPASVYLRTSYDYLIRHGTPRLVYTIHNLQYQGRWDPSILDEAGLERARVFIPPGLEFWGDVNWMKAGINYADVITTVSRRYAEEIQTLDNGWGLDEVLFQRHPRVFGIPNGIDWEAWNPKTDRDIPTRFTAENVLAKKPADRAALREEFGLRDEPELPLVGIVSRLVDQKGFDLLAQVAFELRGMPLQLVVLGTGHERYEQLFRELSESSRNIRAHIGFDVPLSHRIYAGSDFFLMPSKFEPGGLGQLIAMRYGTPPIVHATGGLADTVVDVDAHPGVGNGLSFDEYSPAALLEALRRALALCADSERMAGTIERAMRYNSTWEASARLYVDLYRRVLALPPT